MVNRRRRSSAASSHVPQETGIVVARTPLGGPATQDITSTGVPPRGVLHRRSVNHWQQQFLSCCHPCQVASSSSSGAGVGGKGKSDNGSVAGGDNGSKTVKRRVTAAEKGALKRLWKETIGPEMRYLSIGLASLIASSATNLAVPRLVGKVLDRTIKGEESRSGDKDGDDAGSNGVFLARVMLVFMGGAVASCLRTHSLRMAKEGTSRRLRKKLLRSLLQQDKSFLDDPNQESHKTGELVSVLVEDVEVSAEAFTTKIADGLRSMSSALNGTIALLWLSPKLTLVALSMIPVVGVAGMLQGRYTKRLSAEQREVEAAATAFAQERLANMGTVRAFVMEERDGEKYGELLDRSLGLARRSSLAKGLFMGGLFFTTASSLTAVLYLGGSLAGKGELSGGKLTSFSIYSAMVGLGFSGLSGFFSDMMKASTAAARVFSLLDRQPEVPPHVGTVPTAPCKGHIRFDRVTFSYPNRKELEVLSGLELEIKPGQVVAVVGASGVGKSTVASLLLRLYEPDQGRVLVDGVDIKTLNPLWLRDQVGMVEQEPALFTGTIAENIRYGRPEATDEEVREAARDANALDFIMSFPDGFDTYVGERGKFQLSGGQKQRIAISRAIVKNPPILFLDEATSALDTESERLVQEALERIMKRRTVIVVAHRMSTVEKADMIAVMDKGRVVQQGTFKDLIADRSGPFGHLYESAITHVA